MALEAEGDGAAIASLTIARTRASEEVNLYILRLYFVDQVSTTQEEQVDSWW